MVGRLKLLLNLVIAAIVLAPTAARAQGRFRVLVPYFEPLEGAKDKFGKETSKELRALINTLATHVPIEEKEIKKQVKRFKMKMEELNCIKTRQLASQVDAQVALCATYTPQPGNSWMVTADFWDVTAGEAFHVDPVTVGEKDYAAAAQHIFNQFDRYVQQVRAQGICVDYAASKQWENALRNCDQALELNPTAVGTRYQRARILYEMDRYPEALEELERVLSLNPVHEDALQLAGYISAVEGQDDQARDYYTRYLEMNPANAAVRMKVAYDLAKAGDPVGGMQIIQVGLDVDPENTELWKQFGGFAFSAALEAEQANAVGAENGGGVSPEARELYAQAINAYEKVFEKLGSETPVGLLRNIMAAYIQLDELDAAIEVGGRVLETHPQEDALWSIYADALQRAGRLDDAIVALDRVREINPSHPTASLRQGSWLIEAGRVEDAVAVLKEAAAGNPEQTEKAARMIFADAYQKGYQKKRYQYAITGMTAAKQLPDLSQEMINQLNFWHGFSLYQIAVIEQGPQTLATAKATLPKFQRAMALLRDSGNYSKTVNVPLGQLLENANTYVEIQEAIIKRGR